MPVPALAGGILPLFSFFFLSFFLSLPSHMDVVNAAAFSHKRKYPKKR
jgi:hypothetical protein